jgi:hypothetical protein
MQFLVRPLSVISLTEGLFSPYTRISPEGRNRTRLRLMPGNQLKGIFNLEIRQAAALWLNLSVFGYNELHVQQFGIHLGIY